MIGDSLLYPSYGSFDDFNDGPPEVSLLGDLLEKAGGRTNSWIVFEAFLRLSFEEQWNTQGLIS